MLKYIKEFTIMFGSSIGLLIVCIISAVQLIKKLFMQSRKKENRIENNDQNI